MNISSAARLWIEVASATGVVLGLLFVGLELRHSNRLAQAEAVISLNEIAAHMNMEKHQLPVSSDFWPSYYEGDIGDGSDLLPEDRRAFVSYSYAMLNLYEAAWKYHETGILPAAQYDAYMNGACRGRTRSPLDKVIWQNAKEGFNAGFVADLESYCPDVLRVSLGSP